MNHSCNLVGVAWIEILMLGVGLDIKDFFPHLIPLKIAVWLGMVEHMCSPSNICTGCTSLIWKPKIQNVYKIKERLLDKNHC